MPDDEAVATARKTPVGDQRDLVAETATHDRPRGTQHLAHAWPAPRALVADDDHIARFDAAREYRRGGALLAVEDTRPPGEREAFLTGDLRHRTLGRDIAAQHDQMTVRLDGVIGAADDLLSGRIIGGAFEVLRHGLAGHGQALAVQQTAVEQTLHQWPDAADGHQIGHRVTTARPHVREHRYAPTDAGEVIECDAHTGRMRHGDEVQHRVRRTAERDDHGDRVLEGLPGEDATRGDPCCDETHHRLARAPAILEFHRADRLLRRAFGQRETERLDGRRHRVGGIHATATAGSGDRRALDLGQFLVAHRSCRMTADGLEHRDDVALPHTGADGAAVDEHGRTIETRDGDRTSWHVLVAAADGDESIEPFGASHGLDGVRDHLAGHQ